VGNANGTCGFYKESDLKKLWKKIFIIPIMIFFLIIN
jgi:hypothetical protein